MSAPRSSASPKRPHRRARGNSSSPRKKAKLSVSEHWPARRHDAADADARVASQLPLAEKERVATWVLRNDGGLEALAAQVDGLVETLRARYGGGA